MCPSCMEILFLLLALWATPATEDPATEDPATAILRAFDAYRIVAIGENHGHEELHALVLELLAREETQDVVDDIVVEWGNALYQDVMDRYITGMDVPWDSVTMAWRNTIVSPNTVWDAPVYGQFFMAIREINAERAPDRQYRVLLADSPVEWDQVSARSDLAPWFDRESSMADVLRKESLLKGRRALFLAGGLHVSRLPRRWPRADGVFSGEITPVAWVELRNPGSVYVIQSMGRVDELDLNALHGSGPPTLVSLSDRPDLARIPANATTTLRDRDGAQAEVYGSHVLGDIVDAIILWDSNDVTLQDADPAAYDVAWYWDALNRRSQMLRGEPMDPSLKKR